MTRNPLINALAAASYIVIIASVMYYGTKNLGSGPDDTVIAPIAAVSLFTLSAAVMAYIFGYQPFVLYFDGKKKQAVDLALKTIASFGVLTAIVLALLFLGIGR